MGIDTRSYSLSTEENSSLPTDGSIVYGKLYYDDAWNAIDFQFIANTSTQPPSVIKPTITSPAPGSTLDGSPLTVTWETGTAVTHYYLELGSTQGSSDYGSSGGLNVDARSYSLSTAENSSLPTDGSTVYGKLYYDDAWNAIDFQFIANTSTQPPSVIKPTITSPAPGSTLDGSPLTVTWETGAAATHYYLELGPAPGSSDYGSSGDLNVDARSYSLSTAENSTLPTDGSTVYGKLYYYDAWNAIDFQFIASSTTQPPSTVKPTITSPAPGSTLDGSPLTVTWETGTAATHYYLELGSTQGSSGYGSSGDLNVDARSYSLSTAENSSLPTDGSTVYGKLYYDDAWNAIDFQFIARGGGVTDTTPPVIDLNGESPMVTPVGQSFTDPGATASDDIDGNITSNITVTGNVDIQTVGSYTLSYNVKDVAGNAAITKMRTVNVVVSDTTPPEINLNGNNPMAVSVGQTFIDPGATASDNIDGDITNNISVTGSVDTRSVGSYTLSYNVSDAAGNIATTKTRTVNIVASDTTPPVITIIGDNPHIGVSYENIKDLGAIANDDVDGPVSVEVSYPIEFRNIGNYTVTYTAKDKGGNTSTATRTISVIANDGSPRIFINGLNPVRIKVGNTYNDEGAIARPSNSSSPVLPVTTSGNVNVNQSGIYEITYSAEDTNGNSSEKKRYVIVQEELSPVNIRSNIPKTGEIQSFHEFDDGYYQSGSERSYTRDDAKQVVIDNTTGLIWLDNSDTKDLQLTWEEATVYCRDLSVTGNFGWSWRLPTELELFYLLDRERSDRVSSDPHIDETFSNAIGARYWTSLSVNNSLNAVYVDFESTDISYSRKTQNYNFRCINGNNESFIPEFKFNAPRVAAGTDVRVDTLNNLMWQDSSDIENNRQKWFSAINYCENLEINGARDWRLPNINESLSLISELDDYNGVFQYRHQGGYNGSWLHGNNLSWTSTTVSNDSFENAYNIQADLGGWKIYDGIKNYDSARSEDHVRCVRNYTLPTLIINGEKTITYGDSLKLNATGSTAPTSSIISYEWEKYTYSVLRPLGDITPLGNGSTLVSDFDFGHGSHSIRLVITDNHGVKTRKSITLTVSALNNEIPVANAGPDITVSLNAPITFDGSGSTDSDGEIVSYRWVEYTGGNVQNGTLLSNEKIFTKSDFSVGSHTIALFVTDNNGAETYDVAVITIDALTTNILPVANAGPDRTVSLNDPITFDGSGSTDSDGEIVSYRWVEYTAGNVQSGTLLSNEKIFTMSNFSVGPHSIALFVTDNNGAETYDNAVITIEDSIQHEMQVCPINRIIDDSSFTDSYPSDDIQWIGSNYSNVYEIEKAFNNARLIDESVSQYLKMPSQSVWNGMSIQEQGLYLINSERQARGIKPYEGISQNVVSVAQQYADFIRINNQIIGHHNDGKNPISRLKEDPYILGNSSFYTGVIPESIFGTYGFDSSPSASIVTVEGIYRWIYVDKAPYGGGKAWGHRDQILQSQLDDNNGSNHQEGLIGFGVSIGDYDPFGVNSSKYGAVVVLNSIDQLSTWNTSIQTVDTDYAQLCNNQIVIDIDETQVSVDELNSLEIQSTDILLTIGSSEQLKVIGNYQNGTQQDLTYAANFISDSKSIVSIAAGNVTALRKGFAYISAKANGISSNRAYVMVGNKTDLTNLSDSYASEYIEYIPENSTIENYDPKAFGLFTGLVKDKYGAPISDVTISVHNQPEYGSVKTNSNGRFIIPVDAGTRKLVYRKPGYLTLHREEASNSNTWTYFNDVIMLEYDAKVTAINLLDTNPQTHTSTVVTDQAGSRSTTLVFSGISSATIKSSDGSVRPLDNNFSVRATEYELPQSMPAGLPVESAFTYCSELQIPGVRDDDTVTFDKPVVMYVDNFLNFNVGEIVPIGYYDRNDGEWKASDNGVVVKLLDSNSDGFVDGLDIDGDNLADDINNNGETFDEVVGIENYDVGKTYWRGSFNHFTPWDYNWPYLPPSDAVEPQQSLIETGEDNNDEECKAVNSYVKPYPQAFHEDIPIVGSGIALHYSSQRTEGYKHKISLQVSGDSIPSSLTEMIAKLEIGGKLYERTFSPEANKETEFIWDGTDPSGKRVKGAVRGKVSIGYKYTAEYSSAGRITTNQQLSDFQTAWAQIGSETTGVIGRDDFIIWKRSVIDVQNSFENQIADGWTVSNHHESSRVGKVFKGDGSVIDGDKASLVLKTGIKTSQYPGDDGDYQKGGSDIDYSISGFSLKDEVTGLEWVYSSRFRPNFRYKARAIDYCNGLNRFLDQEGWRLPTQKEIAYTIDKSGGDHNFPVYRFSGLNLWHNSTADAGDIHTTICVKGETLDTNYISGLVRNDTDEVVVDGQNGLMWQDDASTASLKLSWSGSIEHCENLEYAGFLNWRLPNINELAYALPNTTFKNQTVLEYPNGEYWIPIVSWRKPYWSSTPNFYDSGRAWAMESASFTHYYFSKTDQSYVRCVRDNVQSSRSPYRFDDKRRHKKTIDLNTGVTLTTFNYDDQNRLISMTDRFGDTITLDRDTNTGKVTSITTQDGYVTNLIVDDNNDLTQVDYPDGTNYQFIYDAKSLMTDEIDPRGNTFLHVFDADGRVIQTSDPEGGVWDFFSNRTSTGSVLYGYATAENNSYQTVRSILENGDLKKVTTEVDGTELTSTKQADELKETLQSCAVDTVIDNVIDSKTKEEIPNKITITLPSGLTSITNIIKSYAENGADTTKQTLTITQNGKANTVYSDSKTGVSTITSAEGRISTLNSDPDTLLLQSTQTSGLLDTYYEYDARGRQTTVTTGDRTTTYTYDDAESKGDITTIVAADGKITAFEYDEMGRVSKVTYPDGHSIQNSYDDNGNLTTLVVPTPATHNFTHNSIDNVKTETTPLNEVTSYDYDRDRYMTKITLPSGRTINNTYTDSLLTRSITPEGNIDYTYECGAKVSLVTEGSESLSYVYDGNLLTSFTYQGELDATISQSYDTDFRITTLNYAGQATSLSYDDDGLVIGINGYIINRNAQNGLPESVSNGTLAQSRSYNGYGEATSINTSVNNNTIYDYSLTYNDLGKITGKTETLDNGTVNNYEYGYDDKRQLVSVTLNGTEVENYSYDANGNRINQSNSARSINNQSATYNLGDQLQSNGDTTYEYDTDGYLSKKIASNGTTTYQYSSQGRLLQVQTPTDTINYQHNALGNRVTKSVNGAVAEKYLWLDKTTLLAIYDGSDSLVQRFEYADGNTPSSFTQSGQTYYIVADHLGTPRLITNSSGTIVKKVSYDSFGNVLNDTNPAIGIPFGFAGGLQDIDTGLIRFGYRDYDPETGRWTARDPIGFAGGDSNLYGYVFSDPVNYIDPTGEIVPAIIGAIHIARIAAPFVARMLASNAARQASIGVTMYNLASGEPGGGGCGAAKPGSYRPDRVLPRNKRTGEPLPDTNLPHTQLGTKKGRKGEYTQAREFDAKGKPVRDIDFTDHGRPKKHPDPHQHRYVPNETGGTLRRLKDAEPL